MRYERPLQQSSGTRTRVGGKINRNCLIFFIPLFLRESAASTFARSPVGTGTFRPLRTPSSRQWTVCRSSCWWSRRFRHRPWRSSWFRRASRLVAEMSMRSSSRLTNIPSDMASFRRLLPLSLVGSWSPELKRAGSGGSIFHRRRYWLLCFRD